MDLSKVTFGVIGLVVAVLLVALLAIPVVENVEITSPEGRANEGYDFTMSEVSTVSASLADSVLTVNGETVTPNKMLYLALTPDVALTYVSTSSAFCLAYEQTTVTLGDAWSFNLPASGSWTLVNGSDTVNGTTSRAFVYAYDSDGTLGCFSTVTPYVNSGETVLFTLPGVSQTSIVSVTSPAKESATIEFIGSDRDPTQITWTATQVDGAWVMSDVNYNVGGTDVTPRTIAAIDYTAKVVDDDNSMNLIISIVPLLLIVATVMMAVRLIGGRD